jgi:BON domain
MMKLQPIIVIVSALFLAVGCAHEKNEAQYDQDISPTYSSGRMKDYNGYGNNVAPQNPTGTSTSPNAAAAAGKSGSESDNSLVAAVRESLLRNAEIAPIVPNLQITANNGAVQLNGSVQSEQQSREIGTLALNTTGVVAVNNQLQVISTPPGTQNPNQSGDPSLNPTGMESNGPPRLYHESETNGVQSGPGQNATDQAH